MRTKLVKISRIEDSTEEIRQAARLIQDGEIVAFPTETVYGLGGSGLLAESVNKIYKAKGRPSDNPLILHVCDLSMVEALVREVPQNARKAMEHFWPGPMTVILPKSDLVPECVTGGLDTVAIRMPDHEVALEFIREAGVPIAAPSANTSGRPSPTKAEHVMEDLDGRISMILDGGAVTVGVESTIVDFTDRIPVILRPGKITREEMEAFLESPVAMNTSLKDSDQGVPRAPGMKYKHYAPRSRMILVLGDDQEAVADRINELVREQRRRGKRVGVLASEETKDRYEADEVVSVGRRDCLETVTAHLYDVLRGFDHKDVDMIYSEGFEGEPLSEAVMNRLVKAAGHEILRVQKGECFEKNYNSKYQ